MKQLFPYVRQFGLYLLTGGLTVLVDVSGTWILIQAGVYYVTASLLAGVVSFLLAFLLHKYIAFQKAGNISRHFVRYCLLGAWNILAQNLLLILFVEQMGFLPMHGKILATAIVVVWNFFLYRFFVYR